MSDDDEIQILSIKKSCKSTTSRGKWGVPNPLIRKEGKEDIFRMVREKLNMVNASSVNKPREESQTLSTDNHVGASYSSSVNPSTSSLSLAVTPPKSQQPVLPPLSMTPEEILVLTDGCLDSDNEPSLSSDENNAQDQEDVSSSSFKRPNISSSPSTSKKVKLSPHLSKRTSRYFGAGTSSNTVEEILSKVPSSTSPQKKSPSPSSKKKRLPMNSPIRRLPSHQRLNGKSPVKNNARRVLELGGTSSDKPNPVMQDEASNPYYYDAFCYMLEKVTTNSNTLHLFTEKELEGIKDFSENKPDLQLYVRLMNRKDKWLREGDIRYPEIAEDLSALLHLLEKRNFVTFDLTQESLGTLLSLLKVDELRSLCTKFKSKPGTKESMLRDLLSEHRTQPVLGGDSPMRSIVITALGRCVRLTLEWRRVFRRCVLLFSMFHAVCEDLDSLSSLQALLLLQVKLHKMAYPLGMEQIDFSTTVFEHRDQLIRYEEALELKQELRTAIEKKDSQSAEIFTKKLLDQFCSLLILEDETSAMLSLPTCLRRFNAGSVYAYALTHGADAMKRAGKLEFTEEILRKLLSQRLYCPHYRGRWILQLACMFHINAKKLEKAAQELCKGLSDMNLSSVDRMHLQERAEKIVKVKKNGLNPAQRKKLQDVMDTPLTGIESLEIPARAHSGSRPGLKKVYIRDMDCGGKEFMSVEELVIAHFRDSGFKGVHDEGRTVSTLCLLALWEIVYDKTVPYVFQSPYQEKPLDWGTTTFYESRRESIEKRFLDILFKGEDVIANELMDIREQHQGEICPIDWRRVENVNIKDLLHCITIRVFVAICRRLVQNWKAHHCGFPDLFLWAPNKQKCLFVEVKSPNDTLSTIQYMWLRFLRESGSDAIVAYVKESGSKSGKTS